MEIYLITLKYDINFHDADEGNCYAGEGTRIISAHQNRGDAEEIVLKFNPIFCQADKEHTIFPVQKFNHLIKKEFGFTTHDIDNGSNYKLEVTALDLL